MVEIQQRRKRTAFDELLLQIKERPLDLALVCARYGWQARAARDSGAQLGHCGSNESCWLGVGNQCSRVIDQQFLGCAAEVVQARFDGLKIDAWVSSRLTV